MNMNVINGFIVQFDCSLNKCHVFKLKKYIYYNNSKMWYTVGNNIKFNITTKAN